MGLAFEFITGEGSLKGEGFSICRSLLRLEGHVYCQSVAKAAQALPPAGRPFNAGKKRRIQRNASGTATSLAGAAALDGFLSFGMGAHSLPAILS